MSHILITGENDKFLIFVKICDSGLTGQVFKIG